MGLYFIYDHDYFESQQFVRDIKREINIPGENEYIKHNLNVSFVKMTNDYFPNNKQEVLNIYYTALNSGWNEFTFYCNYDECISDVNDLSTDTLLLSNLNSFVKPYNQYSTISTYTTPLFNAKVSIKISRTYDKEKIVAINNKINEISNELKLINYNDEDKIKLVHDYIINHTKYDGLKVDDINDDTYNSETAYGPLYEGYAVCSGYADLMALFLDKMGIKNMRIATATHVWNLVYLDGKWFHLDLTWDDPYSTNGDNVITHNFFLIDYTQLKQWNTSEHNFDENIYKEATNNKSENS